MKASELIDKLNKLIKQHGNLNIMITDHIEGNDYSMDDINFVPEHNAGFSIHEKNNVIIKESSFYIT